MSKKDLISAVAEKTGMTKKASAEAVSAVIGAISEAVANGESVQLVGFGTFKVVERAARNGHNPKTGEAIAIPARKVPVFKAGKSLKDSVK